MTAVRIEVLTRDGSATELTMAAAPGTVLMDACEAHGADVEFSCRAASCSTCRVRVVSGAGHLAAPDPFERELLAALGNPEATRFCCVARVAEHAGAASTIRLQPLGPAF